MVVNTISPFLKVVTVDDSPLIAERMGVIIREIERLVFLGNAGSISSARKLIRATQPDVVILDIRLSQDDSDQTGIDLLIEIRQNNPNIKVIIFTNHNDLHYRLACLEKGASYFFDKSNDSPKISQVLKEWTLKK